MKSLNFLRFRINLLEPSGLGIKNILDKNWSSCGRALLMAPFATNFSICTLISALSSTDHAGSLGTASCITDLIKGILYPSIHSRTLVSEVNLFQFSIYDLNLPAGLLTSFKITLSSVDLLTSEIENCCGLLRSGSSRFSCRVDSDCSSCSDTRPMFWI